MDPLVLSVIIPTFNERDNVVAVAERIEAALAGIRYELIFIDDSTDETPAVLQALQARDRRVRYEHRSQERGLGTAVVRGFRLARGEVLAVMDADLQHPPELLPALFQAIAQGAELVVPSRFVPGGGDGGLSWRRKAISWVARSLARGLLPAVRPVQDATSGYFMLRKSVIEGAPLQPIGWKILIEILVRGTYREVAEVPYRFQARGAGDSKLSLREQWNYVRHLVVLRGAGRSRRLLIRAAAQRDAARPE